MSNVFPILTADEAANLIKNNENVGFSGFTAAGSPKAVSKAIAAKSLAAKAAGSDFKIGVYTGASTGSSLDGELAKADAIKIRAPYQSNKDLRDSINARKTPYFDTHLSLMPQYVRYGFLGDIDVCVIEAADVSPDGKILLTTAVGTSPTYCEKASRIIIERNSYHRRELLGFHDIYMTENPPHRQPIPIARPDDRIGTQRIWVDPKKIIGIVETNNSDGISGFDPVTPVTDKIGENVADFLASEIRAGRIPKEFLPIQSGVGNIANAVLGAMGKHPDIPVFSMYTEVAQDSVVKLMQEDRIRFASASSLTISTEKLQEVYANLDAFRGRILLRPLEISNNPEVIRRLGIISINTALELDIFGNVNSTHVLGQNMMNGIGGSGDFTRNAYISIFTCPSVAKGGAISAIVPFCSHIDHSEHSVQIIVTENGVADLRGKSPMQRAHEIINKCVHEDYKEQLFDFLKLSTKGHTPQTLAKAFAMHVQFAETGSMKGVNFKG